MRLAAFRRTNVEVGTWTVRAIAALRVGRPRRDSSSLSVRQAQLTDFTNHFESMMEAVCDGAYYGPTPKLENIYSRERTILEEQFIHIGPFIGGYARSSRFRHLWSRAALSDLLDADDGGLIDTVIETRRALTLYAEHLRKLASVS